MSIVLGFIPVAVTVGAVIGYAACAQVCRDDLRRLRMLSRHVHHLELEQLRHLELIGFLRWKLAQPRSTAETVARKPSLPAFLRRVA